jgi:hypothetical protein
MIGRTRPVWAAWGGTFVLFGLFARTFHAGVDHFALQLVKAEGVAGATAAVARFYGATHVVSTLTPAIFFGWTVLALGAYLSGTLGLVRSIALGSMTALMIGVLKGSSMVSIGVTIGLAAALVPLGVQVLRAGPLPERSVIAGWTAIVLTVALVFYFISGLG